MGDDRQSELKLLTRNLFQQELPDTMHGVQDVTHFSGSITADSFCQLENWKRALQIPAMGSGQLVRVRPCYRAPTLRAGYA